AAIYPWTLIDYSYGKVLLAPGQRLGYLAISPLLPAGARAPPRGALFPAQMGLGWGFPHAGRQPSGWAPGGVASRPPAPPGRRGPARPHARRARAVGLPDDPAGRHLLPLGRRARRRLGRLRRPARRAGGLRHAWHALRAAGRLPPLADRERRDGRAGASRVPR